MATVAQVLPVNKALEHGCLGKEQHASEAAAWAAQRFRVRWGWLRSADTAHPYECPICREWHLGH